MISEKAFFEKLCADIAAENAAIQKVEEVNAAKDTYTRAEVDALIMEKMKEMKGELNNGGEEGTGSGETGESGEAGEEGGAENE